MNPADMPRKAWSAAPAPARSNTRQDKTRTPAAQDKTELTVLFNADNRPGQLLINGEPVPAAIKGRMNIQPLKQGGVIAFVGFAADTVNIVSHKKEQNS